ncbi:MAG: cytochrome b5 domain-containing protein [Patescibacteria group bacterium]
MNNKTSIILGLLTILVAVGVVVVQQSSKPVTDPSYTTPSATNSSGPTSYTIATVATHNSRSDCWTAVNGSVYNVTAWISGHPGGAQVIIGMCGVDASSSFDAQHGGQRRPESELASFKIGTLI